MLKVKVETVGKH